MTLIGATSAIGGDTEFKCEPGRVQNNGNYRFKLVLRRALFHKLLRTEITSDEYRRIIAATDQPAYVKQLKRELQIASGFLEDAQAFLEAAWKWMLDNWELVLKIALSLLLFLGIEDE